MGLAVKTPMDLVRLGWLSAFGMAGFSKPL